MRLYQKRIVYGLVFAVLAVSGFFLSERFLKTEAGTAPMWISIDSNELNKVLSEARAQGNDLKLEVETTENGIAILRADEGQMQKLSSYMHEHFDKCAGFGAHETKEAAIESVRNSFSADLDRAFVDYTIDNAANVTPMISEAQETNVRQMIADLSAFPNRRYNQTSGTESANFIKNKWTALAQGRSDITVDFFTHPTATSPQPSVVLTIQGTTFPTEEIVLGAHQDSINQSSSTASAPGADDDASGVASLTEAIRVIVQKNFRPARTVKFMAYAAEEVGLRGSAAIANDYRSRNVNVIGVLQLDMTGLKGTSNMDFAIVTDFTNAAQNTFVTNLATTYLPTLAVGTTTCGYRCSDHASWTSSNYPSTFPHESTLANSNNLIHTANDTLANLNNSGAHAVKFTKLGLAFVGELAKGAIQPTTAPRPARMDFDGDGKSDIGIFRPAGGEWWISKSSNNSTTALQFGESTDKITPGDYTGDGKADVSFWRASTGTWYVLRSENNTFYGFTFGTNGDIPAPADFDGDGKIDPALFRSSNSSWFIQLSSGGTRIESFGQNGDVPAISDYDGDNKADIAIYRPAGGEWWISKSTGGILALQFGESTDKPVAGDYTGDGKADVAFFRPSNGTWYILRSENFSFYGFPFGANGDVPAPGDYDGDGKMDAGVFRASTGSWYLLRSTAGFIGVGFGTNNDLPVESAFVP